MNHPVGADRPNRWLLVLLGGVLFFSLTLSTLAGKHLTVEQIYGSDKLEGRSLEGVKWTPDGTGFTYVTPNEKTEKPDLWLYTLASGERMRLVSSEEGAILEERVKEKRFTLDSYLWSPAGEDILIPCEDDLSLYHLPTGEMRQLTHDEEEERDPQFSPDGRKVAFLKKNNLHVLDVETEGVRQLTHHGSDHLLIGRFDWVYEEEFDIRTGFFWSPDGRHIAYFEVDEGETSEFPIVDFLPTHNEVKPVRYPKPGEKNSIVRVGVVPIEDPETVWMDIGDETDMYMPRITWLPDGRRLAIQRLNRNQNRLELLVADVATGATRIVLTEEAAEGWLEPNDDLTFLEEEEAFIWMSQRDGFSHLYLCDTEGQLLRQLTRGNWAVHDLVGTDEEHGTVYFIGTEKSILERHLYRVHLDGTGFERLSREDGTHDIDMAPDCRHYLDTFSNLNTPPRVSLYTGEGEMKDVIEPNEMRELFEEYELSAPQFLTVSSDDGSHLHAFMIKPPDFDPSEKYPVLVYTYGGPGSQIVCNNWRSGMGRLWHQLMAQKGYIIFGLDNRGTGSRGTRWMWTVYRNLGEYEVRDNVSGVRYLQSLPYVDSDRIGIWGWSYGGYTTCMCMLKAPDIFKAGVAVAPVVDWRNYDTIYSERYMGTPADNPKGYEKSAATVYADSLKGKLLLVHGSSDDNVHVANTMQLAEALQRAGKPFDLMIYPGKAHSIRGEEVRVHLFNMITEYFLKNL